MISFSVRELLVALYFEQVAYGKGSVPIKVLQNTYDFGDLLDRLIHGLLDHGLAEPAVFDAEADSTSIALTAEGLKRARAFAQAGHKAKALSTFSDGTTFSDGSKFATQVPPDDFDHPTFEDDIQDSANWTGLPSNFVLSEEKKNRLLVLLEDVEERVSGVNIANSEKAQVRSLVIAARILAEAPEPPADVIWELINRASQLAGVAALFVSIIGLFK